MASSSEPDYQKIVQETREAVLSYATQEWPVVKSSGGVEVSTHQFPDVPVKLFKAVGIIDASPATTLEYIIPGPTRVRPKWDKSVKTWQILKEVNENTMVLYSTSYSAALGLISPRDYVDLVTVERDSEGTYFTYATGIDYPHPEDPSLVRGWNYPSGIVCFPVEGDLNKTKMMYVIQTDLKGKIPHYLIDSTLPSVQVSFYGNCRKAIKDKLLEKMNS